MKEDIDNLLIKLLGKDPLNEEEIQQLQEWLSISFKNKKLGKIIRKLKSQKKILDKHQNQDTVFIGIEYQVYRIRRKRQFMRWSSCVAVIILLIGFFFILQEEEHMKKEYMTNQTYISNLPITRPAAELIMPDGKKRLLGKEQKTVIVSDSNREMRVDNQTLIVESNETKAREPECYTMNVPLGAEYDLILADGTKVFLNAGSSLRYPDLFNEKTRDVSLTGEAYFEVAHDPLHPFIVHVGEVTVRVQGTSFNINAYPEEEWVRTTLVEGQVATRCGNSNFVMKPGTQVAYNKETKAAECFPVDTEHFISWKNGYQDFEDMPLEELMRIFSRWYNIEFEFISLKSREVKFSGRLKRYDTLDSLLEKLEYTRDVRFIQVRENKFVIRE